MSHPSIPDLFPETLLVNIDHGHIYTTSVKVADHFGKMHKNVLRDIEKLLTDICWPDDGYPSCFFEPDSGQTFTPQVEFGRLNFEPSFYLNMQAKRQPMYYLSRDAFSLLAMGFTGREALVWKLKFLQAFNAMEAELHAKTARFASALDQVRPSLRPVVEGTQGGLSRAAIAAPLGKSCAAVSYHRGQARRLGLLGASS